MEANLHHCLPELRFAVVCTPDARLILSDRSLSEPCADVVGSSVCVTCATEESVLTPLPDLSQFILVAPVDVGLGVDPGLPLSVAAVSCGDLP